MKTGNKIVVVGAGYVGVSFAYQVLSQSICKELIIIDIDEKKAEGEVIDLNHGMPFVSSPTKISTGTYSDCHDADIIVITAGRGQKDGETRLDLINSNAKIMKNIVKEIMASGFNGIIIVASNPVDILANIALKYSGLPKNKVFGTGTSLDTARLKYLISNFCNISDKNVHTYILGEHGDSEFPVWSNTLIYGTSINDFCKKNPSYNQNVFDAIFNSVKNAAYDIIRLKGATNFAIGLALVRICNAIFTNENLLLPISAFCDGEYGLKDINIGVPVILNRNGIREIVELSLTENEQSQLTASAIGLKNILNELDNI